MTRTRCTNTVLPRCRVAVCTFRTAAVVVVVAVVVGVRRHVEQAAGANAVEARTGRGGMFTTTQHGTPAPTVAGNVSGCQKRG